MLLILITVSYIHYLRAETFVCLDFPMTLLGACGSGNMTSLTISSLSLLSLAIGLLLESLLIWLVNFMFFEFDLKGQLCSVLL